MSMIAARGDLRPVGDAVTPFRKPDPGWIAPRAVSDATLTILLVTYNHEKYILKALQSVSLQKVDIPVEIMVADDCSTDSTRRLISEYFEAHPIGPVRFLDFKRNRGVTRNYQRSWACLTTKYVAVLEGDDYWTSPNKLAKQVAFLEANGACVGCSANYLVGLEGKSRFLPRVPPAASQVTFLDSRSLIHDNLIGNFSTCVYRTAALKTIPAAVYDTKSYDWIMNIAMARWGPIAFLHDVMSVYRVHANGTWGRMSDRDKKQAQIEQIREYDRLTSFIFTKEWDDLVTRLEAEVQQLAVKEGMIVSSAGLSRSRLSAEATGVQQAAPKISIAGRIVRKIHSSMPAPVLNAVRFISPGLLRAQIRKIGKS